MDTEQRIKELEDTVSIQSLQIDLLKLMHQTGMRLLLKYLEANVDKQADGILLTRRFDAAYCDALNGQIAALSDVNPHYAAALRSMMVFPGET